MCNTAYANKPLEVSSNELWTVVTDNPGRDTRIALACSLDDRLDVAFFHFRADFPVHDRSAVTIEQAAKEEECSPNIDIGDVDVPVLVRTERLLEASSLEGRFGVMALHQSGIAEHSVDARGASCHHIGVEHHEGETPVTLKRVFVVKLNDGLLFPVFKPPVARNPAVMLVHFTVALPPVIELAPAEADPPDELPGRDLRSVRPIAIVIDNLVANVMGNPGSCQSSPSTFFSVTCSSNSSATTSFLRCSLS
jgi:hypothetical protein